MTSLHRPEPAALFCQQSKKKLMKRMIGLLINAGAVIRITSNCPFVLQPTSAPPGVFHNSNLR